MKHKNIIFSTILLAGLFACVGCGGSGSSVSDAESSRNDSAESSISGADVFDLIGCAVKRSTDGNRVEIHVDYVNAEYTLADVMRLEQDHGSLTYEISGGMIMSIDGKANAADWSSCWMLYTSDAELSNKEYGTITVDGKEIGSAIVGAESLPVQGGEIYVWDYVTF